MGKKPREKMRKTMSEKITDWKNEAHDILHADDKLNDIIDRAEEENDAE